MSRRTWILLATAAALVLGGAVAAALLLGDRGDPEVAVPSGSPAVTSSVAATDAAGTPAPSAPRATATAIAATPTPEPPAEIELAEGDIARVIVDDVRVRSEPRSSAEATDGLSAGEEVAIVGGPEVADGYQWFEVRQGPNGSAGWVASGTHDGPWLARVGNGRLALVMSGTDGGDGQLVTLAPDGSDQRVVAEGSAEMTFTVAWPAWSPDGSELLAVRAGTIEDPGTYRMPADGGELVRMGSSRADAAWSPDGSLIAMGVRGGIELVDEYGESRLIELDLGPPSAVGWAPDGSALVFAATDPDPQIDEPWRLFTVPVDGGEPSPITDHGYYYAAGWSPDGSRIAYFDFTLSAEPPPSLHLVDPDGGNDVAVRELQTWDGSGRTVWSPDGMHLVSHGDREIIAVDAVDGSAETIATLPEGWIGVGTTWAPDGRAIAVVARNDPRPNVAPEYQLSVVNVDGSGMQSILDGARDADWQPVLGP